MSENNQNLFDLSDDEIMNMGDAPEAAYIEDYDTDEEEDNEEENSQDHLEESYDDEDDEDSDEFDDDDYDSDDEDGDYEVNSDTSVYDEDSDDRNGYEDDVEETKEKATDKSEETSIDYKATYEAIFKPFKANGKEIQVKSVEDVIQLMQMGANYTKKMSGIKDKLPILKMLENNNLLDEDRLSFAIDLLNGDANAIGKLIKENDIDTYDIDDDEVENYKPSDKRVTQQEIILSETLDDLRESKNFNDTMKIVTEDWDDESKKAVFNEPEILKVLDFHLETGIYKAIQEEIERLEALNKLNPSMSSLQTYKLVGDLLNEQGAFNYLVGEQESKEEPQTKKENKSARKRKSAQRLRSNSSSSSNNNNIDPLDLSDEEFQKLAGMHEYI